MANLSGAYARVKRANQQINSLKRRERAFNNEHKNNLVLNVDPQTGKIKLRWLGSEAIIPNLFNILVGEAIYNLRAAMDYLIYELAILDSHSVQNGTQFPICDGKADFGKKRKKCLIGLSATHVRAIKALQPCYGCTWTGTLRDVSNPDKHKKLTVLQRLMRGKFQIFVGTEAEAREFDWADGSIPATKLPLGGRIDLEPGDEEVRVKGNFALYIAFSDGLPVINTLDLLRSHVALTLDAVKREFK